MFGKILKIKSQLQRHWVSSVFILLFLKVVLLLFLNAPKIRRFLGGFSAYAEELSYTQKMKQAELMKKKPKSLAEHLIKMIDHEDFDEKNIKKENNNYFNMINTKTAELNAQIAFTNNQTRSLKSLERQVQEKIERLQEEKNYFIQTIQQEKKIKQERLDELILFYQKMEPKKAAPIFAEIDKDLAVALFKAFPRKQTMQILAMMPSKKSVLLSEYYAKIRSAKEYELLKEINFSLKQAFNFCDKE